MPSKKKMKAAYEKQIRELANDIIALVESEKNFEKATMVRMKWEIKLNLERAIWQGYASQVGLTIVEI